MKNKTVKFCLILVVMTISALACALDFHRNSDGSLGATTVLTEAMIQEMVNNSMAQADIQNLEVELRDGYIDITGELPRQGSDILDQIDLNLDLVVSDGQLRPLILQAAINDIAVDASQIEEWNQQNSTAMVQVDQQIPNAALESVNITSQGVILQWRLGNP